MALSFPILFFMAALIFVCSKAMVLTSETATAARTDSFKQALQTKSAGGFDRFVLEDVATSDRYTRDIHNGGASQSATVIPVLGWSKLTANARVAVLRNTWDYHELPLNDSFRLELYGQIAAGGGAGKLTSIVDQIRGAIGNPSALLGQLGSASEAAQKEPPVSPEDQRKLDEAKSEAATKKKGLENEVAQFKTDIKNIDAMKQKNDDDLRQAEQDEKDKKITADELKAKREAIEKDNEALDKMRAMKQTELNKKQGQLDFVNKHS